MDTPHQQPPSSSRTDAAGARAHWLWLATAGAACACFIVLSARPAYAQGGGASPFGQRAKTESPYFFVQGADPSVDALPLKSTDVQVRIAGPIADVTVTQRYRNEGTRAIEARYVFPGSTRAAVHGMSVRLGDRLITADIREKQRARIEYDAAKQEGRTAALLEQHQPNVFQMNVAHILPGDEVRVELRYTELLVPDSGRYRFVFPTVVGPRYNSPASRNAGAAWVAQPVLPPAEPGRDGPGASGGVPAFDLRVALATPLPLADLASPSHAIRVAREERPADASGDRAAVTLQESAGIANDRDFILDYRLAGERIQSGLLLHRGRGPGEAENFFLAMIEPPRAVDVAAISPREYVFVVDVSGSMHGFPLDTAKTLLAELIGGLRASDRFNVLLFSGSSRMLSPHAVPATQPNIARALATIDNYRGSGATELMPALRRVYAEPRTPDLSRTVVVVTDGYVTVESEAFALVRENLSKANLFSFGIGSAVNRHLMEGLARAGMGEPYIITSPSQARGEAERFRRAIAQPVLTSVRARFEGLDVYDVEPAQLPDVLGERPVVVFGKWRGPARGQLVVEGQAADGPYRRVLPVAAEAAAGGDDAPALRHLWARHRIAMLDDQDALDGAGGQREAITALGLRYGLLTRYTSFLAVDRVVRNPAPHDAASVDTPSPLPQGVSALAVGGAAAATGEGVTGASVPATPEPAVWGAVLVTLSVLAMLARRERRRRAARFTA